MLKENIKTDRLSFLSQNLIMKIEI